MKTDENTTALVPRQTGALAIIGKQLRLNKKILDAHRLATTVDEFYVPRDGSLYDAVERVRSGGTIRIAAGEYRIDRVIHINKPLSIVGEGKEHTVLVSNLEEHYLKVQHEGYFAVSHITFKSEDLFAGMVCVSCGEIQIGHNNFVGCYKVKSNKSPDIAIERNDICGALIVGGCTKGIITGNVFFQNYDGLCLKDESTPVVVENIAYNNGRCGIKFVGKSTGKAESNVSKYNKYGIGISGDAEPVIDGNTCKKNTYGIAAEKNSKPHIQKNTCSNNEEVGIIFCGDSLGTAEKNICMGNGSAGIYVQNNACPELRFNVTDKNGCGIYFGGKSTGKAENNISKYNKFGIGITGDAEPVIESNTCEKNERSGISVGSNAKPHITKNTCSNNKQVGILFDNDSSGTAKNNICRGNWLAGIHVRHNACPYLENN